MAAPPWSERHLHWSNAEAVLHHQAVVTESVGVCWRAEWQQCVIKETHRYTSDGRNTEISSEMGIFWNLNGPWHKTLWNCHFAEPDHFCLLHSESGKRRGRKSRVGRLVCMGCTLRSRHKGLYIHHGIWLSYSQYDIGLLHWLPMGKPHLQKYNNLLKATQLMSDRARTEIQVSKAHSLPTSFISKLWWKSGANTSYQPSLRCSPHLVVSEYTRGAALSKCPSPVWTISQEEECILFKK